MPLVALEYKLFLEEQDQISAQLQKVYNIILMTTTTKIFWLLLFLFLYKLIFLSKDNLTTQRSFSIYRDQQGIPHIYAKNYSDIFYGLGYASAQDRLFGIYIKKMIVEGRLAQKFGPQAALSDLQMRNIGFMEMARVNLGVTDKQTIELIQCYADGINDYAKTTKMLPMEFYLFWMEWQDWTVEDTLAFINFLSFNLQFDWFYQIARQRLLQTVGFDLAVKIITYGGQNLFRNFSILSDQQLKIMGRYKYYDFQRQRDILKQHWGLNNFSIGSVHLPQMELSVAGTGSNAWVVGGNHTVNGRPLLANDPHIASLIPSLFYCHQVVLLDENNQIKNRKFGVMPDGLPSVSLGVGKSFAWASTAAYIDNKDIYYETVRNSSGTMQYLYKNEWVDFKQRKEVIKVRWGQDIEETFYHTHRGVVIQTIFMDLHWKYGFPLPLKYKNNHTITLNALHFQPDNTSAKGHVELLTSQTFQQHFIATKLIQHPNVDSVFILENGTYGYNSVGTIPKRDIAEMGSFVKDGNSDKYQFKDVLSNEEEPFFINPQKGYFALANNRFASDHFEFRSSLHQIVTGRSIRLQKIIQGKLQSNSKFDFKTMMEMQLDQRDESVAAVLPKLLQTIEQMKNIWSNQIGEIIISRLKNWNYVMGKDSVEASFYHVWQYLFQHSLFQLTHLNKQEVQAIVNHGFFQNFQFLLLEKLGNNTLTDQQRPVCQTLETKKYGHLHPCKASVALAFKRLPSELKSLFNSQNIDDYKWGVIHQQHFKLIPFEKIPIINRIWQRNFPVGGNSRTLNVAILTHQSSTYNVVGSPSFRLISDLNQTYYSFQVGQSDRVLSPYYDNFLNKNEYYPYVPHNPFLEPLRPQWTLSVDKNEMMV